ncbi:MAG: PepSY domain-containing protein [Proteobacteria bacterium]|nr:PepSY domain-containing protein [Pseudomonadota bacterium]
MRRTLSLLHRWVALAAGLLLALLGLTGSLMVWQAELDAALNPAWFHATPAAACTPSPRPVADTLAVLARAAPNAKPAIVLAPVRPGAAYQVWERREPTSGLRREHFVDPACARYLGSRLRGAWRLDRAHAVPLLYELHSKLLAGDAGHLVVGGGALVLLGLALSGIWLAWPRRHTRDAWQRVLTIKVGASTQRLWFDAHRAVGLWLAPLALLLTATGAALVFDDSTRAAVALVLPVERLPPLPKTPSSPLPGAPVPPDTLVATATALFAHATWSRLTLPTGRSGMAEVRLLQAGEPRVDTGTTRVRLDAAGRVIAVHDPLQAGAGSVMLDWAFPLHSGEALGLAARLLWSAFGLVPVLLLASGLWLWWRRTRRHKAPIRQSH